jgi:carbamoylphosphate synthase large subunit
MFFIDQPYVSDFFKETVTKNSIPIVKTDSAVKFTLPDNAKMISEWEAMEMAKNTPDLKVYTTSENTIGWISQNLSFTDLPGKIDLFKNKFAFRKMLAPLFPKFYFQHVSARVLQSLRTDDIPLPAIIKPAVGFFSLGVHKVTRPSQWPTVMKTIALELDEIHRLYPKQVLDTSAFIIEQCIDGDEFAVDAYFDSQGEPVIVGILQHIFSSESDVSDRVYTTSKNIIEHNIDDFSDFLKQIGQRSQVRNFPVHVELRRNADNVLLPIEVNPMRFGGWCTTADMTYLAYGFNPYEAYYHERKPDWKRILRDKTDQLFSIIVLDNSTGFSEKTITGFHYDKLLARFEKPLELRKINYKQHSVFGFLFTETSFDHRDELDYILNSDLREFVTVA